MVLNEICLDRAEQNIFRSCVDKLQGGGKSETLKKVGNITM